MQATFQVFGVNRFGNETKLNPVLRKEGEDVIVIVPKNLLDGRGFEFVRIVSSLTQARAGEKGYMFYPANFSYGVVRTDFIPREDCWFKSLISAMPVCGFCASEGAVYVQGLQMTSDLRFFSECRDGLYRIMPEFVLDGDDPDEDLAVLYRPMPGATYADMARVYRKYQMEVKGCVPLRQRAAERAALKQAAESMEIRIRMGWKPRPTPVRRQNLENEPPMKVACNVAQLNRLLDKMQEKGVHSGEICLVGWAMGGHDGRFPQQYPSDERFGGDEALRAFIARAQGLGYQVVCHTVSCGAYEIADNWDPALLTMKLGPDDKPTPYMRLEYKKGGLNGGDPWHLCAQTAYAHYGVKDLPKVREYGFQGMHYIDELTACVPEKCYCPAHPVTRKQAWEAYRGLMRLSRELFGGYQSEAWVDYLNEEVDAVLYTAVHSRLTREMCPLFDEGIPFWQLVYHGIVLSNATSQTVNYPIKEKAQRLKFIEYGGRPLMYFNSKFGATLNWMGDDDLYNQTEEQLDASVDALKAAYDEYERLKWLQYEFMENHEKLGEGVYRVTYSDGTRITVDYNREDYTVEKAK